MEWHVWDFPDSVYVKFKEEYRVKLFERLRNYFGGYRKISKLGFRYTSIATCLKRGHDSEGYQAYTNVKIIKKILEIFPEEKEKLERNIVAYKGRRRANLVYKPILPIKESSELYSIVCHIIADGSASANKSPYYSNSRKELLEEFVKYLQHFGEVRVNPYFYRKSGVTYLMFPKAITDVLSHILDVSFTFPDRLPERLFEASNECKIAAIRAMFDDEGTVSTMLSVNQNSVKILLQIKKLLLSLGIKTGRVCSKSNNHQLNVLVESYDKFYVAVRLTSVDKINNLKEKVESHRYYMENLLGTKIKKLLKQSYPLNKHQISEKFDTTPENVNAILLYLEKKGEVKRKFSEVNKPLLWYSRDSGT
jgi:hypothetical protein